MNIFSQSPSEIFAGTRKEEIDLLPSVPSFLSRKETAFVLHVSIQTIDRMIAKGDLNPNEDGDILKVDIIDYLYSHTLADVPVLEGEAR